MQFRAKWQPQKMCAIFANYNSDLNWDELMNNCTGYVFGALLLMKFSTERHKQSNSNDGFWRILKDRGWPKNNSLGIFLKESRFWYTFCLEGRLDSSELTFFTEEATSIRRRKIRRSHSNHIAIMEYWIVYRFFDTLFLKNIHRLVDFFFTKMSC